MLKVVSTLGGGGVGGVTYKGTWDANSNSPALSSGVGTQGDYYVVNIAGNTNLDGITDWQIGDWAIFNGSVWQKVDNTDAVTSVNGQVGAVVLNAANVGATANTTFVLAGGLLSGGGQLNANVTVSLTDVPIANVTGGVANTVNVLAGTGLTGGGALTGNVTLDLANTAVTPGVYGSATEVGQVTIDAQGRITNAANVTIAISTANVSGLGTMATQNANNVNITGGTADMLTLSNANISGSTANTAAMPDPSLPLNPEGYITISINGTNKKVPYYGV